MFSMNLTVITAVNDEGGEVNVARDTEGQDTIPNIAKRYKSKDQPWMLVVDDVGPAPSHLPLAHTGSSCR